MIPLRDDVPSRRYPFINTLLIAINVAAWLYELTLGQRLSGFIQIYGVIPAEYTHPALLSALRDPQLFFVDRVIPIVTSMFLHGGWFHVIGNMLYLYIFGDNVEDRMGHSRYLVFYLLCGLAAGGAHVVSDPSSAVPSIGASGAVAGILGAYLMLYPGARVRVLLPVFVFLYVVEVPALFFLGFWLLQQFLYGTLTLDMPTAQTGGVAWWAHIGGFAAGAVLIWFFRRGRHGRGRRERRRAG